MSLVIAKLRSYFLPKLRVAHDDEPPMLYVEAGRGLNRRFEKLRFLFFGKAVVRVKVLDRAALVDRIECVHGFSLRRC